MKLNECESCLLNILSTRMKYDRLMPPASYSFVTRNSNCKSFTCTWACIFKEKILFCVVLKDKSLKAVYRLQSSVSLQKGILKCCTNVFCSLPTKFNIKYLEYFAKVPLKLYVTEKFISYKVISITHFLQTIEKDLR